MNFAKSPSTDNGASVSTCPLPFPEEERNRLERDYRTWKAANPSVFPLYVNFARKAMKMGKRFSISLLTERIRWEHHMTWGKDDAGFKINNNYRAYIARDLMAAIPGLKDVLEVRRVHEDPSW